jgi:uncharacterized membrane protein
VACLDWGGALFTLCGYNWVTLKPDAHLVARHGTDPMIATGTYGQGRTPIFASDFAPRWAGDFPRWKGYATFWAQMLRWLANNGG